MSQQSDCNTKIAYRFLKAEAARIRRETGQRQRVTDLIALAPQNDPFYTGTPAELDGARWFADIWQRFGYGHGVHLRRVHYQLVSQDPPVEMPNGMTYENDMRSWNYISNASKWARYLDLVPVGAFVDRRNPEAKVYASFRSTDPTDFDYIGAPAFVARDDWDYADFVEYDPDLPELPNLPDLPRFGVTGYERPDQAYLVEVWAEKTTMNDILIPLCQNMKLNLVTGAGELSITAVFDFLKRARQADRPARILYVSDYDPAGLGMPVSVARKVEYYQRNFDFDDLDIALQPIVLTAEQVVRYHLPRVPVKDSDKRKANWVERHGAGQVELDALEALHTGELARIVREAISQYIDADLDRKAKNAQNALWEEIGLARERWENDNSEDVQSIEGRYKDWCDTFRNLWQAFLEQEGRAHLAELQAIQDHVGELRESLTEYVGKTVNVDDFPLPAPELPEEADGKLYESHRDYFTQLDYYKAHQNGGAV